MSRRPAPPLVTSITDVIGGTPAVELERTAKILGLDGRIVCKLEYLNPGFSKKDRPALAMVRRAIDDGSLAPGQTVVELTSGNTGTGLAIVCRALGYPFVAVMSQGNSMERARMMAALGARLEIVPQAPGSPIGQVSGADLALVEERTREIVAELGAFRADQFRLAASGDAHEEGTGPELWDQCGGDLDAFVDFVGSGGSFGGVMRALRARRTDVRGYVVEPAGAAVLADRAISDANHRIQGGGYSMSWSELPLLDVGMAHGFVQVTDEEAMTASRHLAEVEGIFAGFSAGANLAAAIRLLRGAEAGSTVALLACDSGLKYLSTDLFR